MLSLFFFFFFEPTILAYSRWDFSFWLVSCYGCWQLFSQFKLLVFAPKLLPSSASQDRGEVSHTDTGQLFGLAAVFNIWIPSCEVINRSKREFRLKGEEIPLGQLIQSVLWECSRLWHSHWNTLLGDLDVFLILRPRADAEGDGSCQHGPSHPPCRHRAAGI